MDQRFLRLLILESSPMAACHTPPSGASGPGHGETCDGCGEIVTNAQMVMENLDDAAGGGVQLHVACFYASDVERQVPEREPSVRLPARSAFRALNARPTPRARAASSAFP